MAELNGLSLLSDANLKAYYRLEDVNDTTANAFHLTNNGTVTFAAAKYSNGADLGSSNSSKYLSYANTLGITTGAITMAGWVKLQTEIASDIYKLFIHSSSSNVVYNFGYEYNGGTRRLNFVRGKPGGTDQGFTYDVTLGATDWYHLAYTYDTTTIRGYVNGADIGNVAASGTGSVDPGNKFTIGGTGSAGEYTSALFDDVAIFNRALNASEVLSLYNDGVGGRIIHFI